MRKFLLQVCLLFFSGGLLLIGTPIFAGSEVGFTPDQVKNIEGIVHNYIVKNPEVLIEAGRAFQEKNFKKMTQLATTNAKNYHNQLVNPDGAIILGDPNGSTSVVLMYDYLCGGCRIVHNSILNIIKTNKNLRVVLIQLPLNKISDTLARIALAANDQGKFDEFDKVAIAFNPDEKTSRESLLNSIADKTSLDMNKVNDFIANSDQANQGQNKGSGEKDDIIKNNYALYNKILPNYPIQTPMIFVTATKGDSSSPVMFFPGAASESDLTNAIQRISGSVATTSSDKSNPISISQETANSQETE